MASQDQASANASITTERIPVPIDISRLPRTPPRVILRLTVVLGPAAPKSVRLRGALQSAGSLCRRGQRARQIFTGQFGNVRIAPASTHQLLEQRGVPSHTLETSGGVRNGV